MSKVKFKTNANINVDGASTGRSTKRQTGRSTTRQTGKSTARKTGKNQTAEAPKKGGSGIVAFLVFMILAGGGGAGAFVYFKKQKEVTGYIVTKQEADLIRVINKRLALPTQNVSQLNFVLGDIEEFEAKFTIPQIVMDGETQKQLLSPNIDEVFAVKEDVVESLVAANRDKKRIRDYEQIRRAEERARLEVERRQLAEQRQAELDEAKRTQEQAKKDAADALFAKGVELNEGMQDVRWEVLDSLMFERSMFRPLEGKFSFNFISSLKLLDPWRKFPLEKQKDWGNGMAQIFASASNTFGMISNSGTDFRGVKMFYEKREGTIMNISKEKFRIRVVDNVEGVEITRSLDRDIIDIPPTEFYKLINLAIEPKNLAKSKNASKNWAALQRLHPGKTDQQILDFGYSCIMYMFKEFPSSKKIAQNVSEIPTGLLFEEMKLVEPTHNRREMNMGVETAQALYDEGKRQDSLMILEKMRERFGQTAEWDEFKEQYVALKESSLQIKKR